MHCQPSTEITQETQSIELLREKWINYLSTSSSLLSKTDQHRIALTEMMHLKSTQDDLTLFHLTLTYKPYQDRIYREQDVNKFFLKFYLQHFLPYLLNTRRIQQKRKLQPICLAFVDGNWMPGNNVRLCPITNERLSYSSPAQLHHHAILAVHHENVGLMRDLIGTNTLADNKFSYKVCNSDLRECDAMCLLYSSKMLKKYPDFMSFPDRSTNPVTQPHNQGVQ